MVWRNWGLTENFQLLYTYPGIGFGLTSFIKGFQGLFKFSFFIASEPGGHRVNSPTTPSPRR